MLTGVKVITIACKCVFYRQEHMQRGVPWKWNLEVLKCKNEIYQTIELKEKVRKLAHLSSHHVYSQNWGHKNVKSGYSSFVFSVHDSKVSLTVWANYLGASQRFSLVLSGNSMDYWILMGISKMSTLENAGFQYFFCWVNSNPKVYHSWKNSGNSVGFFTFIFPNRLFFFLFFFFFCCHH